MENKKILVTGASGFIGRALTEELCRNNEVWGLARFRNQRLKEHLASLGVELIVKDVARDKLDDMPQDFDYVFSELVLLGAELLEHPDQAYEVNAYFVGRLMEHCRRAKGIILGSTGYVYPQSLTPLKEDSLIGIDPPAGLYSASKSAGEVLGTYVSRQMDIPACLVRYHWPYEAQGGRVYRLARAVADETPVEVNRRLPKLLNPHYMSDCVRYTIEASNICSVPPKPLNVGGMEAVSEEQLLKRIGETMGKAPTIVETDRVGPFVIGDVSLMTALFGEPEVSLDEGIARVVDALRKNVSLPG
jgi:nucleoside-diphosphate-sugar epimerase